MGYKLRRIYRHYDPETGDVEYEKLGPKSKKDAQREQHTPRSRTKVDRAAAKRLRKRVQSRRAPPTMYPAPTPRLPADDTERYQMRRRVLREAGYRCQRCGCRSHLTVDHIIPLALGGGNHRENLQCLCEYCNTAKGQRLPCEQAA